MQPNMIIHTGAPKTGSTFLQKLMVSNRDLLRSEGIYYPQQSLAGAMAGNAKLLVTAMLGTPTKSFTRTFPAINVRKLQPQQLLEDLLQDWNPEQETIVLSAENFRPEHAAYLHEMLPSFARPRVITYIRRQDSWAESMFKQLTKTRDITENLGTFVNYLCNGEAIERNDPNWLRHYTEWRRYFPDYSMASHEVVTGDIFGHFAKMTELSLKHVPMMPDATNVSPDAFQMAYLLALPKRMTDERFFRARNACLRTVSPHSSFRRISFLSPAMRTMIKAKYTEPNARLAQLLTSSPVDEALVWEEDNYTYMPPEEFVETHEYQEFVDDVTAAIGTSR